MNELLVFIGAELILLVSIVALMVHDRRADVLSGRSFDEADYTVPDSGRTERRPPRRTEHKHQKLQPRALTSRQQTTRRISWLPQLSRRQTVPSPRQIDSPADYSPERRALRAEQVLGRTNGERDASTQPQLTSASLPDDIRIYAIGDIHGRSDLLRPLLRRIEADCQQRPVKRAITVFVGDYIDRGPHSRNVIDLLLRWRETNEAIFLRGNHETFLPRFLSDAKTLDDWRQCGGLETLLSYGLQPTISPDQDEQVRLASQLTTALPKAHLDFLKSLDPSYSCGDFFFVHAGIRPGIPISEQDELDLLWIRDEFLAHEEPFERIIVHGHTPVEAADFRSNRINIDTGAFATGHLTCIVIEGSGITQLPA
jgi:calcineurin-like phosphoesterase family protein